MTETIQTATAAESKSLKGKAPKKTAKTKTVAAKTKPAKAAKPKREKAPMEDLMVFAFRISKTESAALHKAAGPANASRVMRSLAGAFVAEDRAVFESIVEDARKLR